MDIIKLPQLRVLVTDYCDSACVYCRPGGEGNLKCNNLDMDYNIAVKVAEAYRDFGGDSIKISGGDPVFWKHLTEYIKYLKDELQYRHIELITRSVKIRDLIEDLKDTGLDVMNFSLDTLDEKRYYAINKKNDFSLFKETICECTKKFYCKINTVILPDTSETEIYKMINFCSENGVRELKLLDFIDDLDSRFRIQADQNQLFNIVYPYLDDIAQECETEFQGGLGHPMQVYRISNSFKIICKDANKGAWYCDLCLKCTHYPCHDALMALRVTPSNTFQLCLLNNKMHWNFDTFNLKERLDSVLKYYQNAFFEGKSYEQNNCANPS